MGTIRKILLAFLLTVIFAPTDAQRIVRQSINSFGISSLTDGYRISETVGQPYFTQTTGSGSLQLHPGFQQHMVAGEKEILLDHTNINIKLYPNPASSELWITSSSKIETASVTVHDMNGKVIYTSEYKQFRETSLDVSNWPAGLYAIRFTNRKSRETSSSRILIIK